MFPSSTKPEIRHFHVQSNLCLQTPLYYAQFIWSQKSQKSYIPYLYSTDTSIKRTLGSVHLVSVLQRFDCIVVVQQQLRNVQTSMIHAQSCCFANPKPHCLFAVLVAVAVVVA